MVMGVDLLTRAAGNPKGEGMNTPAVAVIIPLCRGTDLFFRQKVRPLKLASSLDTHSRCGCILEEEL